MLLSLSIVSSIAIVIPNNASAQEDQQQRGLLGGLEREQRDEAILGQQPADINGSAPLNRTIIEDGDGGAQPSACAPTQTGGGEGAGGGNQTEVGAAATTNATTAGGGAGNQSTSSSSPTQLIEQACMALQAGDIQGAMMQLNLALGQLREGGGTTTGGATSTTTGPGGIGTDDPSATDNPFSDLT